MFLFSLKATEAFLEHIQLFMVGHFLRKKLKAKNCFQKYSTINFWLVSKYDSWQYCQKNGHLKDISLYVKFLVSLFLLFCTNERKVLQREIKDWAFEFLTGEPNQFIISADWIIEHDLYQILCVVLEFLNFFFRGESFEIVFGRLKSCPDSVK